MTLPIIKRGGKSVAEKPLKVPAKFSVRHEFWNGFGGPEAITSIIATLVIIGMAILGHILFDIHLALCMLSIMVMIGITLTVVQKFDNGISIVDYLKIQNSYRHSQQKYMYKYLYNEE